MDVVAKNIRGMKKGSDPGWLQGVRGAAVKGNKSQLKAKGVGEAECHVYGHNDHQRAPCEMTKILFYLREFQGWGQHGRAERRWILELASGENPMKQEREVRPLGLWGGCMSLFLSCSR